MTRGGWVIVALAAAGLVTMWIGWARVLLHGVAP